MKITGKHARNTLFRQFSKETGANLKVVKSEYYRLPHNDRYNYKKNLKENL